MKSFLIASCLLFSTLVLGQSIKGIDALIKAELKSKDLVSLAVGVIDSGQVVHLGAYGYRDLNTKAKAAIHTPFHIASVSKTVTNIAVFRLVEDKKVDLNTDVNKYLPFFIENPYYPDDKITIRDLLNHRSGIRDDGEIYGPHWSEPKGDPVLKLGDFLKDYLHKEGALYKKEHFDSTSAYRSFSYSNTGVALLGLIVQHVSGKHFEEYCQEQIFKPLGMSNTSWFLKHLDSSLVAKTYHFEKGKGHIFKGHNGYPDYPGGQLRTSIADLSLLLSGYLNAENGNFILDRETTNIITPNPRMAQEGFFTWFLSTVNNDIYYMHNGGDVGVSTVALIDVGNKNGVIIFANTGRAQFRELVSAIVTEMWGE